MGEFSAWFSSDADCRDYLEWLRWPGGFVCPRCEQAGGWRTADGRLMCTACGARSSPTAGTIFDRTRTPLTLWFTACWLFATRKDGISALSLKRSLEIGSYQTAWAMLHRVRSVLVRPGRDRLQGTVELDETYIGGEELGLRGGRAKGKKTLVAVAVERIEPRGFGRARMAPLADTSAATLRGFLIDNVEPGATVITDGLQSYRPASRRSSQVWCSPLPRNTTAQPQDCGCSGAHPREDAQRAGDVDLVGLSLTRPQRAARARSNRARPVVSQVAVLDEIRRLSDADYTLGRERQPDTHWTTVGAGLFTPSDTDAWSCAGYPTGCV